MICYFRPVLVPLLDVAPLPLLCVDPRFALRVCGCVWLLHCPRPLLDPCGRGLPALWPRFGTDGPCPTLLVQFWFRVLCGSVEEWVEPRFCPPCPRDVAAGLGWLHLFVWFWFEVWCGWVIRVRGFVDVCVEPLVDEEPRLWVRAERPPRWFWPENYYCISFWWVISKLLTNFRRKKTFQTSGIEINRQN